MQRCWRGAGLLAIVAVTAGQAHAQGRLNAGAVATPDNGTDPTKLTTQAAVQYEHLASRGSGSIGTFKASYIVPLGEKSDCSVRLRVPAVRLDAPGVRGGFGLSDASVQLTHVFGLTPAHGFVAQGEVVFDTARRAELGTGKTVLKGSLIYAKFLSGGAIFAPAVVQSNSVGGDGNRATVNTTVFDFYYVPRLDDPQTFVTVDPALSFDWEADKRYASLAVTVGRALGPALGGSAQVFVKPSVFGNRDRPANWGLELGFKLIGF